MVTFLLFSLYVLLIRYGAPDFGGIHLPILLAAGLASALVCEKAFRRFGAAKVAVCGVLLTVAAAVGAAVHGGFLWLVLLAVPIGVCGGIADRRLRRYASARYSGGIAPAFGAIGAVRLKFMLSYFAVLLIPVVISGCINMVSVDRFEKTA
ncbi:MAG: hypothetical protein LBH54_02675, partial [Clostridiales bacterium]|nr:hypothetical protein [Clostridiales bacterium]